jgi:hypothetical protein
VSGSVISRIAHQNLNLNMFVPTTDAEQFIVKPEFSFSPFRISYT